MGKSLLTLIVVSTFILAALYLYGYGVPGSLNWGVHFLGFLPPQALIIYLMLIAITAAVFLKADIDRLCAVPAGWMEHRPELFLAGAALLFVVASLLLRVHASLLGDSFTLIMNFRDASAGVADLAPWHEPLSIFVLYHVITLIASLNYPDIFAAFHLVDTVIGLCFLVTVFFIVRSLFQSPVQRLLAFTMLLSVPYMEFFFGYVEVYAVSTLLLAVFILASLLVLQQRMPFTLIPAIWLLMTLSHYVNGVLILPVLYLTLLAYRRGEHKPIALGYGIACVVGLAILAAAEFRPEHLINLSPVSHFLSLSDDLSPVNAYSQAYTMFSMFHLIDAMNYLAMMAPFASVLLVVFGWNYRQDIVSRSRVNVWFSWALAPLFLLWIVSKLEQGNASDWDVYAGQFVVFHLFILHLLFQFEQPTSTKVVALIVCVTIIHSTTWFTVNASAASSVRRFVALWDKRNLSHLGNYTMALRLSRYFDSANDSLAQIDTWHRYAELYPGDPRGYRNTIEALNRFAPEEFARKESTYLRWIRIDPTDQALRRAYGEECIRAGQVQRAQQKFAAAGEYFRKAIRAQPNSSTAYTELGAVCAGQGMIDSAVAAYRTAIRLDSANADAFFHLGRLLSDGGDAREGMALIRSAATLGSREAKEILNKRSGD